MMSSIRKILFPAIVFIVAFFVVKYGLELYNGHAAGFTAEHKLEEMKQQGIKKHPDMPVSESMYHEAASMGSNILENESDPEKRLRTAAIMYFGFYLVNTRERPDFCNEQGVNISPFVSTFLKVQRSVHAKAKTVLSQTPYTEDKLYEMLQPQMRKIISQDMQDIASKSNTTIKGACELISASGEVLASKMSASADVYQELGGIK